MRLAFRAIGCNVDQAQPRHGGVVVGAERNDRRQRPGVASCVQIRIPRAASHPIGSIFLEPPAHTSKCRCGPVDWPRLPIVAI